MATTDERLTEVTEDKEAKLTEIGKTYDDLASNAETDYQKIIDDIQENADKAAELQQKQTDFAIQQIEQQKAQAQEDYTKEQSGAYVDWQKQSNQYGVKAEQVASAGLQNSGYSESSQVSMYNTYQYRVTAAREAFKRAELNYANAIQEAKLQNSSILAEIATNAFKEQAALALELVQYRDSLVIEKANKLLEVEQIYDNKYQNVLEQIYNEEQLQILKEQQELEEAKFAYEKEQDAKAAAAAAANKASRAAKVTNLGGAGSKAAVDKVIKKESSTKSTPDASAYSYLNALIASGASKDKVSNEIAIALREGEITKEQATKLRNTFTPRGVQY